MNRKFGSSMASLPKNVYARVSSSAMDTSEEKNAYLKKIQIKI